MTNAIEDYLKAIFEIGRRSDSVTTSLIAARLGISASSVTSMLKRLSDMGLVRHQPYRGVSLTDSGRKRATALIRHHRIIETYLVEKLGVPWETVHEEADKWEHVVSEDIEARMFEVLDRPSRDPHGSPIPERGREMPRDHFIPLSAMPVGQSGLVVEVSDRNAELLRYLFEYGVVPGARVTVKELVPFGGSMRLSLDTAEVSLGIQAAENVFVNPILE